MLKFKRELVVIQNSSQWAFNHFSKNNVSKEENSILNDDHYVFQKRIVNQRQKDVFMINACATPVKKSMVEMWS